MARYTITTWNDADVSRLVTVDCHTRGSATHQMWKQAYEALKAFGKLDTIAAHRVLWEVNKLDDLMPVGASHCVVISNTGRSITIARHA